MGSGGGVIVGALDPIIQFISNCWREKSAGSLRSSCLDRYP